MFYQLKDDVYLISDGNEFLIHSLKEGGLCRINQSAKEILLRLAKEKNAFDNLSHEYKEIMRVLMDEEILLPCKEKGSIKVLSSIKELNKKNIAWFRDTSYLVVKITNRCNLGCKYCSAHARAYGEDMLIETFCDLVNEVLKSTQASKVTFLLFGGEPTLLPIEWYEKAIECLIVAEKKYKKKVSISMQSNFIDISQEKLDLFKRFNVRMSASIDNPINLKASCRPRSGKAVATFLKAKRMGMRNGIILTINSSNVKDMASICEWLDINLEEGNFKANIMHPVGDGSLVDILSPEEIFTAQKEILNYMIRTKGKSLLELNMSGEIVKFFENYLERKQLCEGGCDSRNCGAGKRIVSITPRGDILPCGRCESDVAEKELGCFNNYYQLNDEEIDRFFTQVEKFHHTNVDIWQTCSTCEAKNICGYGCKAFISRLEKPFNFECQPTLYRFEFYKKNKNELRQVYVEYKKRKSERDYCYE